MQELVPGITALVDLDQATNYLCTINAQEVHPSLFFCHRKRQRDGMTQLPIMGPNDIS